eukprot:17541-Prymnesium_polylepis.1
MLGLVWSQCCRFVRIGSATEGWGTKYMSGVLDRELAGRGRAQLRRAQPLPEHALRAWPPVFDPHHGDDKRPEPAKASGVQDVNGHLQRGVHLAVD